MTYISIEQSLGLTGSIIVDGAKNSILPIAMASILSSGVSVLHNVTDIKDVHAMCQLLEAYGCITNYNRQEKVLCIDTSKMRNAIVPYALFQAYRASTIIAGALLAKFGEVWLGYPGGDKIGKRPIDIHLAAFKAMGAEFIQENDHIHIFVKKLHGASIFLEYPSVGATQNILLAAALCEEKTTIMNAAQEPEVFDMIEAMRFMGVKINLQFCGIIEVIGNKNLRPFDHTVIPDRLEAATLLIAAAITRGNIQIANAPAFCMQNFIIKLRGMGFEIEVGEDQWGITLFSQEKVRAVSIKTMPYPGFSTDLQPSFMALLSTAEGKSTIHETVFESRMSHAFEMNKMGANITIEYDYAKIIGVDVLYGTVVHAHDIRACASLVLAGLVAKGYTRVYGVNHLKRGYEGLEKKLRLLGANISIITEENSINHHLADVKRENIVLQGS